MRIVVIAPFLNEEMFLPRFLGSIAAQTRQPDKLILVDDGSTDRSSAIAEAFATEHPFAVALRRPSRVRERDRLASANELRAFAWALEQLDEAWDVVAKLDADLDLNPQTIAEIEQHLTVDPGLGMAGSYLTETGASGVPERLRIREVHVHGATKFYRRECWQQIAPIPAIHGWDTIDEVRARMRGWRTRSFEIPGGDPVHLRPRGTYDGVARGFRRAGAGAYRLGDHPLHVLLYSLRHLRGPAGPAGTINYLAGWCTAGLRREPRADEEVRGFIRADELRRMRRRLRLMVRKPPAPTLPLA
jgi:glycosyltransferase involved in cell wall biosynthesis